MRIALDELGGEYVHQSDLRRLPLDYLKVDRGALAGSEDEEYRSWLLEGIVMAGQDLSLPVIATGVESHEELTKLQSLGCAMAQGFYLGRPAAAADAESLFQSKLPAAPATAPPQG